MTLAVIRPGKHPVIRPGENTGEAARQASRAEAAADAAAASEAVALAAAGPNYADTAAGLAATSEGETFAVEDDGIVTIYRHDSGPTATELRVLPTTAALASTDPGKGAALVTLATGETVQQFAGKLLIDAAVTITVGSGGDFATVNEALAEASTYRRKYKKNGERIEVKLLSGFVMAEQVFVISQDLSFITITAEDAEVTVTRSALTDEPDVPGWRTGTKALFAACQGGWLPVIGALFSMDNSGDGVGTCGVVIDQQSFGIVLPGCGVKNAGWRGLYGIGGYVYARNSIWDGAGLVATTIGGTEPEGGGVRIANGGSGSVRGASAKGCAIGLYLGSSRVVAVDVDVSGAKIVSGLSNSGTGVYLISGIHALLSGMNASGAERHALKMTVGATAWLNGGDLSDSAGSAINMSGGSTLYANGIDASGAGNYTLDVTNGSVARLVSCDLSGATSRALSAGGGSTIVCFDCDLTGAGDASPIRAYGACEIRASNCVIDQTALCLAQGGVIRIYACVDGDSNDYVVKGNIPINASARGSLITGLAPPMRTVTTGTGDTTWLVSEPNALIYTGVQTADRTLTLQNINSTHHTQLRVLRAKTATGAFTITVNGASGALTTLANAGDWAEFAVNTDRTDWVLMAKGTLP